MKPYIIICRFAFILSFVVLVPGLLAYTSASPPLTNYEPALEVPITGAKKDIAPEPTAQPGNLSFSDIKSYAYDAFFNNAIPQPDNYIVLRSKGQAVTGVPTDGVTYHMGDAIGNARVVYIGGDAEFTPNGVVAGTTFHHSIFSFNGTGGSENYLQANPLTGAVTTAANMMGNYYQGVNSKSPNFVETLQNLIRPHTSFSYSSYPQVMINGFEAQDTTGGQKVVYCVYTGYAHVYDEPFGWIGSPGGTLSREHTFPHSWFPTYPSNSGIEYSDFYNLFPVHQNNANNRRSNHPLGVVQNVTYQFLDGKLGTDVQGNLVYEPRNSHKGDAARALFYMVTRYNTWNGNQWSLPAQQNQDVLKLWHFTDPPDAWEIARNDYISSRQGNRNPFIDSIHFVTKIDFQTMQWLSVEQIASPEFTASISPNPARGQIQLNLQVFSPGGLAATLYDLTGIPVKLMESNLNAGTTSLMMEISDLPKGAYILKVIFKDQTHSIKILKF